MEGVRAAGQQVEVLVTGLRDRAMAAGVATEMAAQMVSQMVCKMVSGAVCARLDLDMPSFPLPRRSPPHQALALPASVNRLGQVTT